MAHAITGEGGVSFYERRTRTLNLCIFGNFPESPVLERLAADIDSDGRSSVQVSHQSRFCVAYGSGGRLQFATRTGLSEYSIEDVDVGGGWPSLVFDGEGSAHLAHVANGTLKYAKALGSGD
ncbi:hypothetical protein ACQPWW_13550 [Micromonospora sp. CA-240977]|uniref:hypothetical protein n=1 Tax=Micromonospora sp. CA-240977 TaxID=3239957 RepID=UPI003D9349CF